MQISFGTPCSTGTLRTENAETAVDSMKRNRDIPVLFLQLCKVGLDLSCKIGF